MKLDVFCCKILGRILGRYIIFFPKLNLNYLYCSTFGYLPNYKRPKDLNEWINKLILTKDSKDWYYYADKYSVREYVKSCGYENILTKLYGVWSNVESIDFDNLPQKFVLKTNQGCGDYEIVEDKKSFYLQNWGVSLWNTARC